MTRLQSMQSAREDLDNDMNKSLLFAIAIFVALAGYIFVEKQYNPRQFEAIGNALEKNGLIRLQSPRPGEAVRSPLLVQGLARGYWFFEASFPVRIYDKNNKLLGISIAQAQGDWMTEEFVPFQATLEFKIPATKEGTLVLEKDNPSGLPEHADELRVPVRFQK
jgi:hypothetical protein